MNEQDHPHRKSAAKPLTPVSGDDITGDHTALDLSALSPPDPSAEPHDEPHAPATISDASPAADPLSGDYTLAPELDLRTARSNDPAQVSQPTPLPPLAGVFATSPTLAPSPSANPRLFPSTSASSSGDRPSLGAQADPHVSSRFQVIPPVHYRIDQEIARGGMGRIMLAFDHRLQRQVAIKELLLESAAARRRFKREALITARLQHPSIVNVYEAGCWPGGEHFYAMEKVNGRSLQAVIDDCKTLQARLALLPRVIDVSEALAYAHSQGVIHRDLKPDNILVGSFGETVVIDWGLAKDLNRPDEEDLPMQEAIQKRQSLPPGQLTLAGSIMGTPGYMPPEQAEGKEATTASDVYAIGAILYHLLAGEPPFKGESSKQVLLLMLSGSPPPLSTRLPDLPPELMSIVEKAMQRDPTKRYKDAGALASDLRRFETGKLVASHAYSPLDLLKRWVRRYRTVLVICTAALVGLIVIGVVSFRQVMTARDAAEHERNAARDANRRLELEHAAAVAARTAADDAAAKADLARIDALAKANEVAIHEARSALQAADPSRALAWLRRLNLEGQGWDAAHLLAVGAWHQGHYQHIFRGNSRHPQQLALSAHGLIAATTPDATLHLWNTADRSSQTLTHPDGLDATISLDPEGRYLAAVTRQSRRVVLADLTSGQFSSIKDSTDTAHLAFSPDGQWLAMAQSLGTLSLYAPARSQRVALPNLSPLSALAFSPDSRWLATATTSGTLTLRSTDGLQTIPLPPHGGTPSRLVFTPDSRFLLALDPYPTDESFPYEADGKALLIDLRNPQVSTPTVVLGNTFTDAAFSFDSSWLALCDSQSVRVLTLPSGAAPLVSLPQVLAHDTDANLPLQLAFSADSRLLVWRTAEGLHAITTPPSTIQRLQFIPDVRLLQMAPHSNKAVIVHNDRSVRVLDLDHLIQRVDELPSGKPADLLALPSGKVLVVARHGGLWTWTLAAIPGQAARPFHMLVPPNTSKRLGGMVTSMQSTPDGEWALLRRDLHSGAPQAELEVWNLPHPGLPKLAQTIRDALYEPLLIPSPDNPPLAAFFSAPRQVSIAYLGRERVLAYDLPDAHLSEGSCLNAVPHLRVSPDGQTLAILMPCEPALWLLDIPTGVLRGLEFPESRALSDALFTPDGQALIVAAAQAGTLHIDRSTWLRSKLFDNAHDAVSLSISPSGRWLTADIDADMLRVWDLSSGRLQRDLYLPPQDLPLSWSPDSASFATTHNNHTALWDVISGESRLLLGHTKPIVSVAWDRNTNTLLTTSRDATLRAWPDNIPTDRQALHAWLQENVLLDIDPNGLPTSTPPP